MSTLSDKFVHRGTPGDPNVTGLLSWHGDGAGYYTRDQVSSTINTKKCTTSFWIKIANEAYNDPVNQSSDEGRNYAPILSLGTNTTNEFIIYQRNKYASDGTEDTLRVRMKASSTTHVDVMTRGKLRDPGQWTHICVVYDSTQSTDSDRVKIFINNERQTQWANTPTWPSLNQESVHGISGLPQQVGRLHTQGNGNEHRSIISDFYFLDGVAIEPNNNFVKRSTLVTGKPLVPLPYDGDMDGNSFHLKWGDIEPSNSSDIVWQPSAAVGHGTVSDEGVRGATYNFPGGSGTYGYKVDSAQGNPFVGEDSVINLDNASNYISFPVTNGEDLDIGTGQFQIDFWIRFKPGASNSSGTGYHTIWDHGYHQAGGFKLQGHNSKLSLVLSYKEVGSTSWTEVVSDQANTLTEDTWYHYVVNRDSSGDVKLYRDASLIATSSSTHNDRDFDWTGTAYLGYSGNNTGNLWHHKPDCDIADFRFFKGGVDSSVTSSNPTETKSTSTSNLKIALQTKTDWHGQIKNEISTGPTPTLVGDFDNALPFGDTSSIFSRGEARWGVHLDEHSDFNWGTDDFEISFWVMLVDATNSTSTASNTYGVFWQGNPSSTGIAASFEAHDGSNQWHPQLTVNGHHVRSDTSLGMGTWGFVSCGRKNGQLTITVNDNSSIIDKDTDSFTSSTSLNMTGAGDISIGAKNATSGIGIHNGWVTDFRVVKGSNSTNVITDSSSSSHGLYPMNGLTQQSAVKKFDGALDFGGNTPKQFVEINDHNDFNFGSGDFTIEGWIYPRQTSNGRDVIGQRDASATSDSSWLIWQNGNTIQLYLADDDGTGWEHHCTSPSISTNTWHHFAAVRNGSNIVVYIDGTAGTAVNIGTFSLHNSSRYVQVGGDHDSANSYAGPFFYGYMDDIRITKSAVYTSNFTAPTSALSSTNSVLHIQCAASDHTTPTEKSSKVTGTKLLIQPEASSAYKDISITDSSDSSHTLTAHNDGPSHPTPHNGLHNGGQWMRSAGPHTHKRDSYSMQFWGGTKTPASASYTTSSNSSYHAWTWDDDFCLKFWLKIDDSALRTETSGGSVYDSKIGILARGTGNFGYTGYLLAWSTEDFQLRLYSGTNNNASSFANTYEWDKPVTWNRWHFVEVSKDGSNLYLFLDGELANSYTGVGNIGIAGAWGYPIYFNNGSHDLHNWGHNDSKFDIYNLSLDKRKGNTAAYTIPSTRDYVGTHTDSTADSAGNGNFTSSGTTSTLIDTPKPGETYNIFHSQNWQGWEVDTDDIRNAGLGMTLLPHGSGENRPVAIGAVWGASGRHCSKKYYWETQVTNQDYHRQYIGVGDPQKWSVTAEPGDDTGGNSWAIIIQGQSSTSNWTRYANTSDTEPSNTSFGEFAEGDICGIAWDVAGGKIWYSRNGVWRDGDPAQGTSPSHSNVSTDEWLYPVMCNWYFSSQHSSDGKLTFNFGQNKGFSGSTNLPGTADNTQDEFYYAPPSGFVAMKTSEMPAPVSEPNKYFDAVTYTGTYDEDNYEGDDPNNITGLQFQPGIIWIRHRDTNASYYGNYGFDSVLGFDSGYGYNIDAGEWSTGAQFYGSGQSFYGVSGVSSNGFSVDGAAGTNYAVSDYDENYNPVLTGDKYVAYCWKLGSTGSSSTWTGSGADPDTEHYNANTGISVIQKDNSSGSIGSNLFLNHSLGKKPAFAVFFDGVDLNYTANTHYSAGHYAWHQHLSANKYLKIDTNAAESSWSGGDDSQAGDLTPFPSDCSTTTTFKIGDAINISAIHCWLFAEVAGFSRFGYYEGRGDTPFYNACGFKPKFLMIKRIDSTGDWTILDSARNTLNTDMGSVVDANNTNDETSAFNSTYRVDFTSNGFVLRNTGNWCNNSSGKYIFMAFAHRPFSYSNGMGGS